MAAGPAGLRVGTGRVAFVRVRVRVGGLNVVVLGCSFVLFCASFLNLLNGPVPILAFSIQQYLNEFDL